MQSDVGGRPETLGSEEAHRPSPAPRPYRDQPGARFGLQAAGLIALALIAVLTFLILPPKTVRIAADDGLITVESRAADRFAVVRRAGVDLRPGDRIESAGDRSLVVRRATEARLEVDGRAYIMRSQAETVAELLVEAGVALERQDSVLLNGVFISPDTDLRPGAAIGPAILIVRRAVPFTVIENGRRLELRSSRETVATALRDVGVRLGPGDAVRPPLDGTLVAGMEVEVDHAVAVVVTLPEERLALYTLASTVGEALAAGGVALPPQYRLEPPAEALVSTGLIIHVVGISEELELEQERLESSTVYQADASLLWGESRLVAGRDGVRFSQYRVVYENEELVSRELTAEWFDPEPVDTVIYYSTAEAPLAANPPEELADELDIVRTLRVYATWYNPASAGRLPSDPRYGITATGVPVDRGVVAVDPGVIPLGTRLYIPGYGYGVAADTGGGISGNMIDLGYPDGVVSDWTSRWVEIYILAP